jgi:regulator of protease activity HflC (stomatin/prohibitin superfamily)
LIWQSGTAVVPEDHKAVVVDRRGFVRRVISAGVHHLKPGLEQIEFTIPMKTKLVADTASQVPTADGILLTINWSGTYTPDTDLITEKVSQRLRGLTTAERSVQRKVDHALRTLVGSYTLEALFKPNNRARIERQLTETVKVQLRSSGVVVNQINLQAIVPPDSVLAALNQAQAIHALDQAIRASDQTTREVIVGAHQLEEMIEWSSLFPPYGRQMLTKTAAKSRLH